MASKKNVAKQTILSLEDQKQAEFSFGEEFKRKAETPVLQGYDAPWVMKYNEPQGQQSSASCSDEQAGLHASSLELAESLGGSLPAVHSQIFSPASHRFGNDYSWNNKDPIQDSGECSSIQITLAGFDLCEFPCDTINSKPTCQYLDIGYRQGAQEKQVSGDTETEYTENVGYQGCVGDGRMQNLNLRGHVDSASAQYNQLMDQNAWINNTLEGSRQLFSGLSLNQHRGANTPSDKPLGLSNHFRSMNNMRQEMGSDSVSHEPGTAKFTPSSDQELGNQATTQDWQGIGDNYGNSSNLQNNVGKAPRNHRSSHSFEPYSKMSKRARELLKKKQIQEQLDFVEQFHGICPKLIYSSSYTEEDENQTPPSPTWPGK